MMFTFKTRGITRAQWKIIWRQQRIINRETMRTTLDCVIFGTGFLEIGPEIPDLVRCVDPAAAAIRYEGARS